MFEYANHRAAAFVTAVLVVDGLVHAYWTTGARWPASDAGTLSQLVLGADDVPFAPIVVGPLAAILLLGALVVSGYANRRCAIGRLLPRRLLKAGMLAMTAAIALRALLGVAMTFTEAPGSAFFWLNLLVYTPLCCALVVAAVVTMREASPESGVYGVQRDRHGRARST